MLELRTRQEGDFDFTTRRLEESEKKFYGIFISHAADDNEKYLFPLRDAMIKKNMHPLCDRDFLSGGDEFQMKIEDTLDCYAAVIIITRASLASAWVNYEIGFLSGRNIPIKIWDPEHLLAHENRGADSVNDAYKDAHLRKYMPAYHDMNDLLNALSGESLYSEMFTEENTFLDSRTFNRRVSERVETIIATIESEIFDVHYADFCECRFGVLVPNFGMFYPDHGDGEHCYAKRGAMIENGICPTSCEKCALSAQRGLTEENKECVLLNYVRYSGAVLRKNEPDRGGKIIDCGRLAFHVPLHKLYGTEFKFIMDVFDTVRFAKLMTVLEKAGMCPTSSESRAGYRIYLSLPERRAQGLFKLDHEYKNNFLCPHAGR